MLVVTTPQLEGNKITAYYGVTSGKATRRAKAVLGAGLDCETIRICQGSMLMVSASGTAVF